MRGIRCAEGNLKILRGAGALHDDTALAALRGFFRGELRQSRAGRNRAEELLHARQHLVCIEVTCNRDDRVVRGVVGAIVLIKLLARHALEVALPADHRMMVRVRLKCAGLQSFAQQEAGAVFVALPLGDDHRALEFGLLRIEHRVAHTVGLYAQREIDAVRGQGLEVGREVDPRHAIEHTAFARDGLVEFALGILGRTLEKHMFDPVGYAGDSGMLVAAAHAIPHPEAGNGRVMHLAQHDRQAIIQNRLADAVKIGHRFTSK